MSQGVEARSRPARSRAIRTIALAVPSSVRLRVSDEDFWRLCQENPDLRLNARRRESSKSCHPQAGAPVQGTPI